jgi:NAD(P)-dependent dehydrogenase (short-subunit alcohol dehydrogenase family)
MPSLEGAACPSARGLVCYSRPMTTVFLTGATDGIGRQTAVALARAGARVVVHGRDPAKARAVADEVRAVSPEALAGTAVFDLASLASVREGAAELRAAHPKLDVLLHNAGVFMKRRVLTKDGFETTFAVNHLAHVLLTHELLPIVPRGGRIIHVSSIAHQRGSLDLDDLQGERRFDGYGAYALSKLANVLFTAELGRRLPDHATSSLHPGVVTTKLLQTGFGTSGPDSLDEGSRTSVFLALSEEGGRARGEYFVRSKRATPSPIAADAAKTRAFYELSCEMVRVDPLPYD